VWEEGSPCGKVLRIVRFVLFEDVIDDSIRTMVMMVFLLP